MKAIKVLLTVILIAVCVLFIIYFWNLDQKVMAWAYTMVNKIFDRKKVDLNF